KAMYCIGCASSRGCGRAERLPSVHGIFAVYEAQRFHSINGIWQRDLAVGRVPGPTIRRASNGYLKQESSVAWSFVIEAFVPLVAQSPNGFRWLCVLQVRGIVRAA